MNLPTPPDSTPDNSPGFFFWQLPPGQEQHLRARNLIREEEGYLAHEIYWGRALLDVQPDPASVPPVARRWDQPATAEHLSDAMSAVLQVAVELGLDPETVCDRALHTHRAVRRYASRAVCRDGLTDADQPTGASDDTPSD